MAISKIGGTDSDNWELISSATPTGGAAAVNFTGLSPYKKLMIRWTGIVLSAANEVDVRLNNDSGTNYNYFYTTNSGGTGSQSNQTKVAMGDGGSTSNIGFIVFSSCDNSGIKFIENGYAVSSNSWGYYQGYYLASAIITQVNLVTDTTFTAAGTVALYGVK